MKNKLQNYGFVVPKITEDNYVLGGLRSLPKIILQENGQWDNFLPEYEPQFNAEFDTSGCAVWGTENAIEILDRKLSEKQSNYSERFIYILARVRPPGSNPHDIAETIRKSGLIEDLKLPFTATFDEFLTPDPMAPKLLTEGQFWHNNNDFGHEWVWTSPQSEEKRTEMMKECLKYSPLGVSVTAWFEEGGVYVDNGMPNTHWCVCFGWNEKGWKIFDSYDQSIKILSYDHNIQFCKRYYLKKKQLAESRKKNWLQEIIKNLWASFLDVINPDRLRTGGLARSSSWAAFRKHYLLGKSCAVCGGVDKMELHHIQSFSTHPELELRENNVLPLCESGKNGVVCHRFFGHLGNYRKINPDVVENAKMWYNKLHS